MHLLETTGLVKIYGSRRVVNSVDINVKRGEIVGLLGPNGAGKTTTMKSILGLIHPDAGTIEILGNPSLSSEIKSLIGVMPENTYLYKYLTGREFLRVRSGGRSVQRWL